MTALLEASGISKSFRTASGPVDALRDFSLSVPKGVVERIGTDVVRSGSMVSIDMLCPLGPCAFINVNSDDVVR